MLLSAPFSPPSVFRSRCLFRFISRQRVSWPLLLRAGCLAWGVWFAWATISAELMMSQIFSGREYPVAWMREQADRAVQRFPFDSYLRGTRDVVRFSLPEVEADGAPR